MDIFVPFRWRPRRALEKGRKVRSNFGRRGLRKGLVRPSCEPTFSSVRREDPSAAKIASCVGRGDTRLRSRKTSDHSSREGKIPRGGDVGGNIPCLTSCWGEGGRDLEMLGDRILFRDFLPEPGYFPLKGEGRKFVSLQLEKIFTGS